MKHHRIEKARLEKQKRMILKSKFYRQTGQKREEQVVETSSAVSKHQDKKHFKSKNHKANQPAKQPSPAIFEKQLKKFNEKESKFAKIAEERAEKKKKFHEKQKDRAVRGQKIEKIKNTRTGQPNLNLTVMGILEKLQKEAKEERRKTVDHK